MIRSGLRAAEWIKVQWWGPELMSTPRVTVIEIISFPWLHEAVLCRMPSLRRWTHFSDLPRVTASEWYTISALLHLMPKPVFFSLCSKLTVFLCQVLQKCILCRIFFPVSSLSKTSPWYPWLYCAFCLNGKIHQVLPFCKACHFSGSYIYLLLLHISSP